MQDHENNVPFIMKCFYSDYSQSMTETWKKHVQQTKQTFLKQVQKVKFQDLS